MKNTFVKVLSLVMALMMVVGTFSTLAVFAEDEHVHTKGTAVDVKEANCKDYGVTLWKCGECGENWTEITSQPIEDKHVWKAIAAKDATCVNDAQTAGRECEKCGEKEGAETVENSRKFHTLVREYKKADCTTAAYYFYKCSTCGGTVEQILNGDTIKVNGTDTKLIYHPDQKAELERFTGKLYEDGNTAPGHKNERVVKEPTLCEDGWIKSICSVCGTVEKTITEIKAVHDFSIYLNPMNAPCSEYESDAMRCSQCDAVRGNKKSEGAKDCATVVWNDDGSIATSNLYWVIGSVTVAGTTAAFNTANPEYTIAGGANTPYYYNREADKWERATLAKMAEWGYEVGDKTYVKSDCQNAGYALVQCACGAVKTVTAPKTVDHRYKVEIKYATKCTEATVKTTTCLNDDCDYKVVETLKAAAAEHTWELVTNSAATCVDMGTAVYNCTAKIMTANGVVACGYEAGKAACTTKTEYTDALGHKYGEWKIDTTNSTIKVCTGANAWVRACTVCKDDVAGHFDYATTRPAGMPNQCVFETITVEATCQRKAYTYEQCKYCKVYVEVITPAGEKVSTFEVDDRLENDVPDSKVNPDNHVYPTAENVRYSVNTTKYNAGANPAKDDWALSVDVTLVNAGSATIKATVEPGCFTTGSAIVSSMCTCGSTKTIELPALGHIANASDGGNLQSDTHVTAGKYFKTVTVLDENGDEIEKVIAATDATPVWTDSKVLVAPTCQSVGYLNDGQICILCQTVIKAPTTLAKDPYNHAEKAKITTVFGSLVPNNCQEASYVKVYTDCCGESKQWAVAGATAGEYDYSDAKAWKNAYEFVAGDASKHTWQAKAAVAYNCEEAGNHSYIYCSTCGYIDPATIHNDNTGNYTSVWGANAKCGNNCYDADVKAPDFAATGHNAADHTTANAKDNTTCDVCKDYLAAVEEYKTALAVIQAAGVVELPLKPHTTEGNSVKIDATCQNEGVTAFTYCSECGYAFMNGKTYDVDLEGVDKDDIDSYAEFTGKFTTNSKLKAFFDIAKTPKAGHSWKEFKDHAICGLEDILALSAGFPAVYKTIIVAVKNDAGTVTGYQFKQIDGDDEGDAADVLFAGTVGKYCTVCHIKEGATSVDANVNPWAFATNGTSTHFLAVIKAWAETTWKTIEGAVDSTTEITLNGKKQTAQEHMLDWYWSFVERYSSYLNYNGHKYQVYFVNYKTDGLKITVPGARQNETSANATFDTIAYDETKTYESKDSAAAFVAANFADLKPVDCTQKSYIVVKCTHCGDAEYVVTEAKTAHNYGTTSKNVLHQMDKDNCVWAYCDVTTCNYCGYVKAEPVSELMTHYTNHGVAGGDVEGFDFTCTGYKNWLGKTCDACKGKFENKDGKFLMNGAEIAIEHTALVKNEKAETCEENGYVIEVCGACNTIVSQKTIDKIADGEHAYLGTKDNKVYDVDYKAPTASENGYGIYTCLVCGVEVKEVLTTKALVDTVVTLKDATVGFGGEIIATVSISCTELTFNKLIVHLNFDKDFVKLTKVDSKIKNLYNPDEQNITFFTENDLEGNPVNTTLTGEGEVLATLTFEALYAKADKKAITSTATMIEYWCTDVEECEVLQDLQEAAEKAGETVPAGHFETINLVDADEDVKDVAVYTIYAPGHFNNDDMLGASDLQALLSAKASALTGNEVNAIYDVDRNGMIDDDDFNALRKFIFDGETAAAYTQMINDDYAVALDAYMASASSVVNGVSAKEKAQFKAFVKDYFNKTDYVDYLAAYGAEESFEDIFDALYLKANTPLA